MKILAYALTNGHLDLAAHTIVYAFLKVHQNGKKPDGKKPTPQPV